MPPQIGEGLMHVDLTRPTIVEKSTSFPWCFLAFTSYFLAPPAVRGIISPSARVFLKNTLAAREQAETVVFFDSFLLKPWPIEIVHLPITEPIYGGLTH